MKTRLLVSALLVLALGFFSSCDTSELNGNTTNYWSSNALTKMQLLGAVHTMTTTTGQNSTEYTFNTDGNLTSQTSSGSTTTYAYTNGKLISETNGNSTTTFEYENTGKFIPRMPFHIYMSGLVPALSAVIGTNYRTDFDFHGTDLWMISSSGGVPTDTMVFQYTGNYPTSITTLSNGQNNNNISMTYAENGMFKTYTEHYSGQNFVENRVITFLVDDVFQLESKWVTTNTYQNETTTNTTNYTYNDHKELTEQSADTWATQWANYVYDSAGNWTSRQTRYSTGETTWSAYTTETRVITYY
jgi:YD repeat-containing protein